MRALLIKSEYIVKILDGKKTWEIRGSRTNIRGTIGLIRSGSSEVVGVCDVVDCIGPLTEKQFRANARKAGMKSSEAEIGHYNRTFAWVLANPRSLKLPVLYKNPSGAVIWVKLGAQAGRSVRKAGLRT